MSTPDRLATGRALGGTPRLPSLEEIDLLEEKLGLVLSDLDVFGSTLEALAHVTSLEAALPALERGEPAPERPEPLDRDRLARLVVVAADVADDASTIAARAAKIGDSARALFHENTDGFADPEGFKRHRRVVRDWHAREAARREA